MNHLNIKACSNCYAPMYCSDLMAQDKHRICEDCAIGYHKITKADKEWLRTLCVDWDAKGGSENEQMQT